MLLQAVLQDALEKGEYWRLRDAQGKPPGVVGWWPSRAVTFLDNHDTGGASTGIGAPWRRIESLPLPTSLVEIALSAHDMRWFTALSLSRLPDMCDLLCGNLS